MGETVGLGGERAGEAGGGSLSGESAGEGATGGLGGDLAWAGLTSKRGRTPRGEDSVLGEEDSGALMEIGGRGTGRGRGRWEGSGEAGGANEIPVGLPYRLGKNDAAGLDHVGLQGGSKV